MEPVVPLIDQPRGLLRRFAWRYSKKRFGRVADPLRAMAHHGGVLVASGALETAVDMGWKRLDLNLRWLAIQAVSASIGCTWCTDYGYYEAMNVGIDPAKVRDVPRWRESDVYTDDERAVLEYAEAATATPAVISEDLVKRLNAAFSNDQIVELAGWIALENFRSRTNAGLGLRSQGFAESCEVVPLAG
ncbi:MAG: carboxymuconolactone decarboxylase family protein [Frankiaceae bacterium]|nr:carboxymuconolactone decarboxylase family protein [Frankiaceae bacterium]MBV9870503.1 carboxymuconolactone decarboxylase family protein [Frankiaceae bacterium]